MVSYVVYGHKPFMQKTHELNAFLWDIREGLDYISFQLCLLINNFVPPKRAAFLANFQLFNCPAVALFIA